MKKILALGSLFLTLILTGCQPEPVPESKVQEDFPLTQTTVYINDNISHTLLLTEFSITSRQAESKTEVVYCSYELSDGVYASSGEYALSYEYSNGEWNYVSSWPFLDPTVTVATPEPPEEMLTAVANWEEHFSSQETVKQTEAYERISDTQFQGNYSVSESYDYWESSTDYVVQGTLEPWFDSTDSFYWSIQEGVEASYETWDIIGEYQYKTDTRYIYLNIDSFNPETLEAHISYGEYTWLAYFPGEEDSTKSVSDLTVQFTYKEPQIGVPRYLTVYSEPFDLDIYTNSFQVSELPLEKIS